MIKNNGFIKALNDLKIEVEKDLQDVSKQLAASCLIESINTRISLFEEDDVFSEEEVLESLLCVLKMDCEDDVFDADFVKTTIGYINRINEIKVKYN